MSTTPTLTEPTIPPAGDSPANGELTPDLLGRLASDFDRNPTYRLAQNAVTQTSVGNIALNRSVVTGTDHTFSNLLDDWR